MKEQGPGIWWELSEPLTPPEDLPTPECFTDEEWAQWFSAAKSATISRDPLRAIRKDMCDDCTWRYQNLQIKQGTCNPPYEAVTPLHKMIEAMEHEST